MRTPKTLIVILLALLALLLYLVYEPLGDLLQRLYIITSDRQRVQAFLDQFGMFSPLIFILLQILQVVLAPIPGEITGFIGGFLFGAGTGFMYSSIGLGIGSAINFWLGRLLGRRYVRRIIPQQYLNRFDEKLKRQGLIAIIFFFIIPGFPKDYLCLFLGITAIPPRVAILVAIFGRMPGTLMLSLQGQLLFSPLSKPVAALLLLCVMLMVVVYLLRERIYAWVARYEGTGDRRS